jgi:hypothetical protein
MPPGPALGSERPRLPFNRSGPLPLSARSDPAMTVFIYVDTSKEVGDPDHLKVFANAVAADTWLEEHEPEGVAFEYEVLE